MATSASGDMAAGGSRVAPPTYVSGERVFGPPIGTFDIDWVARQIERETSASFSVAHEAVSAAWNRARATGSLDGDALAVAASDGGAPTDVAAVVAEHVRAYCSAYEVDPAAR